MLDKILQMLLPYRRKNKSIMTLERVKDEYHQNDVCMGELLLSIPANGLSLEEAFELSIAAKKVGGW